MTFRTQIHTKKFGKNGFRNLQGTLSHRPLTNTSSLKITAAYPAVRLYGDLSLLCVAPAVRLYGGGCVCPSSVLPCSPLVWGLSLLCVAPAVRLYGGLSLLCVAPAVCLYGGLSLLCVAPVVRLYGGLSPLCVSPCSPLVKWVVPPLCCPWYLRVFCTATCEVFIEPPPDTQRTERQGERGT